MGSEKNRAKLLSPPRQPSAHVQAKRSEKREKILVAARALIAEHGPSDLSIHELSRQLGLTAGALYWYFPSREAIVGEVQRRVFGELTKELSAQVLGFETRARAQGREAQEASLCVLLGLARFYLSMGTDHPEYARLIAFSLDPRIWLDDAEGAQLGAVLVGLFREVAMPFERATQSGALSAGPSAARAVQYWASLQGLAQTGKLARLAPGLFDVTALGMASAQALLSAWGAPLALLLKAHAFALNRDTQNFAG